MPKQVQAYLGLGSNLGDRLHYLRRAIKALKDHPAIRLSAISPVYETRPVGGIRQADYLNIVVQIATSLEPLPLLAVAQQIEHMLHRKREIRWGPRTLDMDILLYGEKRLEEAQLSIPHPRMKERAFVLVPLGDLAPHLRVPGTGFTVLQLLEQVAGKEGVQLCPTISLAEEFGLSAN